MTSDGPDPAGTGAKAFTLVEVIVAIGLVAVTVVALVALLAKGGRVAEEMTDRNQAVRLADAIWSELVRLRDGMTPAVTGDRLDRLAESVPGDMVAESLRLVGSRDGLRVIRESDADSPELRLRETERFYLIEIRRQRAPLAYSSGDGFLAVTATVRWPYRISPGAVDARGSSVALNLVVNR